MKLVKDNKQVAVNKIIRTFSYIGQVEYRISMSMVGFYKNNILFGKIENGVVYLINTLGKLKKLNAKFFLDESLFMQQAKAAYNAV